MNTWAECIAALAAKDAELKSFRAKLDREKMAKVLSDTAPWAASIKDFEHWADELIKYLTE